MDRLIVRAKFARELYILLIKKIFWMDFFLILDWSNKI